MKAVVIGEASGATREQIMKVYPRHKARDWHDPMLE
jgi:hypothetical protein